MNYEELEIELEALEALRNDVRKKELELINKLKESEKEIFGGKTYSDYVNSMQIEETKENVDVIITGYSINAEYKLNGVVLSAHGSIWENGFVNITAEYPSKSLSDVPKKYAKEEKHLREICDSYRVNNPVSKYKEKYRLNTYY